MKNIKFLLYSVVILAVVAGAFISYSNSLINEFESTGEAKQTDLNNMIMPSSNFIEALTIFGNNFFEGGSVMEDSKLFGLLRYSSDSDSYSLDTLGGTEYKAEAGNLTGLGQIPFKGIERDDLNLALNYNAFFYKFYTRLPDIAWLYYTSENDFINLYPWVPSKDFAYTRELKSRSFYTSVIPENDPQHQPLWSPVYLDAAGKGLMVTLSSPIYKGADFMGVVSLDLTTSSLCKMLESKYEGYLIDENYTVVAAAKKGEAFSRVLQLKDMMGISENTVQKIKSARRNIVQRADGFYIYKYYFTNAPWTLLIVVPVYLIILKALLLTIPVIIIALLLLITFKEVANRKKAEDRIKDSAITDSLTGLKNRRYLDTIIEGEMSRADRYKQPLSIISIDLDRFKRINDTWGHPVGDEVLKHTAEIIREMIRKSDVLVRLGGEEFMILLPQTGLTGAMETAEKIRKKLENTCHPVSGVCTASFGVAEKAEAESFKDLYKKVDAALYRAKDEGRNRVSHSESNGKIPVAYVELKWNCSWDSGDYNIDLQHHSLLDLFNELIRVTLANADVKEIELHQDRLMQHIIDHFSYEEKLQAKVGFPGLEEHEKAHRALLEKALVLKESYKKGTLRSSEFLSFVYDDVILAHLSGEDSKYYPYLLHTDT